MKNIDAFLKIKLPEKYEKICDLDRCNKAIDKSKIIHENIAQQQKIHRFCSEECKNEWIFQHQ